MKTGKNWALITGASSGIGRELSLEVAKQGLSLILVGRNEGPLKSLSTKLRSMHAIDVKIIVSDLRQHLEIKQLIEEIDELDIELLINNAGVEDSGSFNELRVDDMLDTNSVNMTAPLQLAHNIVEKMIARGGGKILFTSSIVAFQGVANIANYAATKAYILTLAEGLASELRGFNIQVTALVPGFTDTNFSKQLDFSGLPISPMSPNYVARYALNNLHKTVVIPGFFNKFLYYSGKFIQPRRLNSFSFGHVFKWVLRNKLKKGVQ